ncbi:MAG: hypothetical protein ACE5PV_10125 [Candidatus Poribacteria bacterium]
MSVKEEIRKQIVGALSEAEFPKVSILTVTVYYDRIEFVGSPSS